MYVHFQVVPVLLLLLFCFVPNRNTKPVTDGIDHIVWNLPNQREKNSLILSVLFLSLKVSNYLSKARFDRSRDWVRLCVCSLLYFFILLLLLYLVRSVLNQLMFIM